MKTKIFLNARRLMLAGLAILTIGTTNVWGALRSDWELVTTTAQFTSGETYLIAYYTGGSSHTAVVPMRNETNATTDANGYMYSGTTAGSTTNGTINMESTLTDTSPYEVIIETGSSTGTISIKLKSGTYKDYYITFSGTSNHNMRVTTTKNTNSSFNPSYSSSRWQLQCTGRTSRYFRGWTNSSNYRFTNAANNSGGAQWLVIYKKVAASTFTVTYNANNATSGSVPTDATAYNSGATVTVKGNTGSLARTGYTFGGWNTNAEGTGTNYTAGSGQFQISANTTLYAKWNPTYTVTYNGNGNNSGSVPVDGSSPYSANAPVTVLGNTGNLAKTGWTFAGWNTNATGTGTNRAAGSTFSITANTTLYAKWTCTVTWSVNGATNVYPAQTITYNSSGSKVSSVPTPDPTSYCGQVFAGWTTEEYSGNSAPGVLFKTVGDSPNLNSTGSVTFYAVFADYAN